MLPAPSTQGEFEAKPAPLAGQRVTLTGRFAYIAKEDAERLVARAGGAFSTSFSHRITMLVVGARGWPLLASGKVTGKLAQAEKLRAAGVPLRIISEDEFRELLGLVPASAPRSKSLSLEQVAASVGVQPGVIERWTQLGLVRATDDMYDFRDMVSLRAVTDLVSHGVDPVVIRRSLESLSRMLPDVDRPLAQLNVLIAESGELAAEVEGALLTPSGQLEIRFGARAPAESEPARGEVPSRGPAASARAAGFSPAAHADDPAAARRGALGGAGAFGVARAMPANADSRAEPDEVSRLIEAGLRHESQNRRDDAAAAYRRAAQLAPRDPIPSFNLGNLLLKSGRAREAISEFERTTALDPAHARAWFNLAHAQDAAGRPTAALSSLRRAVTADPSFADAHFNLAELALRLGDRALAARSWEQYLRLDSSSEWAAEARRRLRTLRGNAWA
jgi:tetratricopeptide (TPR) repeat protein